MNIRTEIRPQYSNLVQKPVDTIVLRRVGVPCTCIFSIKQNKQNKKKPYNRNLLELQITSVVTPYCLPAYRQLH